VDKTLKNDKEKSIMIKFLKIIAVFYFFINSLTVVADTRKTKTATDQGNWQINLKQSQLSFTILADGVPFESRFSQMHGKIFFNANDLANSSIDVSVTIDSLKTGNSDANKLALSKTFLDVDNWPTANFKSTIIEFKNQQYWVNGELKLKGVTKKINVPINFKIKGNTAELIGKSAIKRLNFNLGTGDWSNTQWISNEVEISFYLSLKQTN
jgi:polyisoprenoid-binding protein YceI